MLSFILWPLWKKVRAPLKSALAKKFSVVDGAFKSLVSSTVDDLIAAFQSTYLLTDQWKHSVRAEVEERSGEKKSFLYEAFPITSLMGSAKIRAALIERLRENKKLEAARGDAGISVADWDRVLEAYAGEFVRFGLPIALERMIRDDVEVYQSHFVVDVAKAESIKVQEVPGHHNLVILFATHAHNGFPRFQEARKFWKKRNADDYTYSMGDYDGFAAL